MTAAVASRIRFTIFEAPGSRLSKLYRLGADGSVETNSGTQFAQGSYRVVDFDAGDPAGALAEIGRVLDELSSSEAIGLGVPLDGTITGRIITKYLHAQVGTDAIPRTLNYFGWPDGPGLLLLDGDDIDGLPAILSELYPPIADVALLRRPSASSSVIDPRTGKALKTGEHVYVIVDDPTRSKDCLDALMRLAWCRGSGKAAGWLKLSKSGAVLVRGPVDAIVGSPERLSYEGAAVLGKGLTTLPRTPRVIGGKGVLCANDLLAYADRVAPAEQYDNRVNAAKNDPEFCARRAEVQATYRGEHIRQAVARGVPREKAAEVYDRTVAVGTCAIGSRTFVPLAPDHTLYWSDGKSFTVADIQKDPTAFHCRECCDPVEGTSYQSRNCAIIYTNWGKVEIFSRAHGDAFAYVAPLDDLSVPLRELLAQVMEAHASGAAADEPAASRSTAAAPVEPVDLFAKFEPPSLPRGLLPQPLEDFTFEQGMDMGCDMAGVALGTLVVCGAAIHDDIKLQPKRHNKSWLEPARLWGLLVGDVSAMKSPALKETVRPLSRICNEMARDNAAAMAGWFSLPPPVKKVTPQPRQPQVMTMNATPEAVQEILKDSPWGILLFRDELAGFFGSLDQYSGSKGAASADRPFWLESYGGGPYSVNRLSRPNAYIPNLSVSILGGIQPGKIRALDNASEDDGLIQRAIPVVMRPAVLGRDDVPSQAIDDYDRLIRQLRELRPSLLELLTYPPDIILQFDDGALKIRENLEREHLELSQCSSLNRKLAAHIAKYNGIFARLCVVWHCVEHAFDAELPRVVTEDTAQRVANFLSGFLLPHAIAFYAGTLGLANDHDVMSDIAGYILARELKVITSRDVQQGTRAMRKLVRHETEGLFEQLEAFGWLTRTPGPRPGSLPRWTVNPVVHQRFAERAKAEKERRERERQIIMKRAKGASW
jgi:uncharacterized protein DUF3987